MKHLLFVTLLCAALVSCSDDEVQPSSARIAKTEDLAAYYNTWVPETYSVNTSLDSDVGFYANACEKTADGVSADYKYLTYTSLYIWEEGELKWNEMCGFDPQDGTYVFGKSGLTFSRAGVTIPVEMVALSEMRIRVMYKLPNESLIITYKV